MTFSPVASPAPFLRMIALFLIALAIHVPSTRAQGASARERYTILIRPQENTCVYQIADQANQDLFIVRPGGVVTLRAQRGLWVDVAIEDAKEGTRNVPGTRNRRQFNLRGQTPQDTFTVRGPIEGRAFTEHRVHIQCCSGRERGQGCPMWQDAQPYDPTGSAGGGSAWLLRPMDGAAHGPYVAPAPPLPVPKLPPGGPVMRVEEEQ